MSGNLEEKVIQLEVKLMNTLDLLKEVVNLSGRLDNNTTNYLVEKIERVEMS